MPRWLMILEPLAVPLVMAGLGAFAARWMFGRRSDWLERQRSSLLPAMILAAIISAWIPNGGQFLYERGLPLPTFEYVQAASYFPFAFALFAIWHLVAKHWQRGLASLLIPVSFAQPLLWTWAYFSWTVWGFAP
jgi:hypothetical protein